ncbi:MAG: MOSC domain-containing protein [Pseudomonadota bacterium]|nr:MOSC domain-containing protein [Pseudomonadota bacterium]
MKKFTGKSLAGKVVSVHSGNNEDLSKDTRESLTVEIEGIAGDKHHGSTRKAFKVDWQPAGTVRRNERQWSAVSVEELAQITERLALTEPLSADTLGANLCVEGIPELSLLPKGTKLLFPSGAVLLVEEYNPPCGDMGSQIVEKYVTRSGEPLTATAWLRPAAGRRGLVGIVDVPGVIKAGDKVEVQVYEEPAIRLL